jgi:hypothetical protein
MMMPVIPFVSCFVDLFRSVLARSSSQYPARPSTTSRKRKKHSLNSTETTFHDKKKLFKITPHITHLSTEKKKIFHFDSFPAFLTMINNFL